jgi:hypothetical protein
MDQCLAESTLPPPLPAKARIERCTASTILLKILFVIGEVRLALLQERLRLPERQSEHAPDLLAAERAVSIAFQSHGFERTTRHVAPRGL